MMFKKDHLSVIAGCKGRLHPRPKTYRNNYRIGGHEGSNYSTTSRLKREKMSRLMTNSYKEVKGYGTVYKVKKKRNRILSGI